MSRRRSSQEWWTEGEALERAGRPHEAIERFAKAAVIEEEGGRPLRARLLWEAIAERVGATGVVLERLAQSSARARLHDDAFDFWLASAARYHAEKRADDAARARAHALELQSKVGPHERHALARKVLAEGSSYIVDLLPGD